MKAEKQRQWRGPMGRVIDATRTHGNLTVAQEQTLDAIAEEAKADRKNRRALREKLRTSAVEVVRAGRADSAQFAEAVEEAVGAFEQRMDQNFDALEEIHGMLDADQRASVAVALRAQIERKYGPRPEDKKRHQNGFERVASHLALSTFQVDKLEAVRKELVGETQHLRPSRDELLGLVDAFEGEDFRPALNAMRAKKTVVLRRKVSRAGERTTSVLSVFTAEQRTLLADLILEGPRKVLFGIEGDRDRDCQSE